MHKILRFAPVKTMITKNNGAEETHMNNIIRRLCFGLGILALFCSISGTTAEAATRLTPAHLYNWAKTGNITRLQQFKRYINLQDRNRNTALCLAQQAEDRDAYALLLKFGASTKVPCHDDDDPICAVIAGEKTKISPAGILLLGAGAAAGAYFLLDDDDGGDDPVCPVDYPSTSPCRPSGNGFVTDQDSKSVNNITCYKCTYTCAPGWSAGTCPAGKACNTITSPVQCYQVTGCPIDYPFTDKGLCEADGYTCTESANGSGCWKRTGSQTCPVDYPDTKPCLPSDKGYTTTQDSVQQGFNTCYKCAYECAPGWNAGSCPAGLTCDAITSPVQCYQKKGCDTSAGNYDTQQACELANPGYDCTQAANQCWVPGAASQCPAGYDTAIQTPADCGVGGTNGWKVEFNGTSGGKQCGKCTALACETGTTQCEPAGTGFTLTSKENGDYSGNTPCLTCTYACADNYYTSENACTNNSAYQCSSVTDHGLTCWLRGNAEQCEIGSTKYQSVADCGDQGANGWTYTEHGMSGNLKCGECTPKTCQDGSSTARCTPGTYTQVASETEHGAAGDSICYLCTYACNESNAFSQQSTCQAGGYTCTPTPAEHGIVCYVRNGSQTCPDDYPSSTKCTPSGNGFTTTEDSTQVGDNTCYKCTYACATGWTPGSCPSGKTCTNSITSPVACYTGAQCPSDYPFTSQATCQEGGYTCTESASGSGCWKQTGSTSCPSGYSTAYQSVDNCGTSKANGWTFSSSGTSGDLVCGKCTEKDCSSGQTTACATSSYATVGTENTDAYSGDTQCFTCSYTCNNTSGFDSCPTEASSCGTDSVSGCKYVISCDTSKGYILTNGTCACDSRFSHSSCPTGANCSQCEGKYGIDSCKEEEGYIEDNGTCILVNAFNSKLTLTNQTAIDITISAEESKDIYGIKNGANIKNTTDSVNGGIGRITISHFGTGTAYGMYGSSSGTVTNDAGASVAIKSYNGGDAVGIYSNIGGTVINKGSVAISGNAENAYGIYGEGQNTITNEGSIDVEGQNAYGIYVKDGQGTTVTNTETGTITVNSSPDGQAHGIFIDENSSDAVVNNFGTITVNGEVREGSSGITLNGAKLRNYSLMSFSGDADLDALGGKIYLEDGGVYEAESLKGDLAAGSSTVMGGNQDTYVQEGSLKTENADGLNLSSESALFKAEKKQNTSGGYDVVLNRRNFNEFAQNASLGEYLEQNYKQGNLEGMYDDIKGASSDNDTALSIADKAGLNTLTNFADENFQVLRSLNRNMADTILKPSDEPYRVIAGYDNYNLETDNKSYLSGYDLSANSMYTFGDKRIDNKNRLGLGIGYTKISTSYDDGGDRDLNIVTVFMPWLHKFTDNLRLASVLSLGYGYGEYDRGSDRESDITDFFYGLTNELRYTVDLNGYAELEPALMLNALGYTEDGFDEGNGENDLVTKKTHNLSVEAGIGLFLKKEVKTEKYGKFAFKVGGVYYHEFASPFDDIKARHSSGSGWYYIRDDANLYQRDRAVLEAALDYEYKDIALYAKYNRLIQKNDPQLFDLGVKYKF